MGWLLLLVLAVGGIALALGWWILAAVFKALHSAYRAIVPDPQEVPNFLRYNRVFLKLISSYPRHNNYDPGPQKIDRGTSSQWSSVFDAEAERPHYPSPRIDISEVAFFRTLDLTDIQTYLVERLSEIEKASSYPSRPPAIQVPPKPPGEPSLIDLDPVFAIEATKGFTKGQRAIVQAQILEWNVVRQEEHQGLAEKHQLAVNQQKAMLAVVMAAWEQERETWVSGRIAEATYIREVLDRMKGGDFEFTAATLIRRLPMPPWVPIHFEVRFDHSSRILIVEHEFPNIEAIEWIKRVELRRSMTSRAANKSEAKLAAATLYPALSLFLAVMLARALPTNVVDAIAVNGWAQFHSKSTGILKRAYCAAMLAKVDRLRDIDLQYVDPLSAYSTLKGNASRSLELTPIAPTLRMDVSDSRFVDPKEVLSKLDDGENLAAMDWEEFEHLCRELFERVFASAGATVLNRPGSAGGYLA